MVSTVLSNTLLACRLYASEPGGTNNSRWGPASYRTLVTGAKGFKGPSHYYSSCKLWFCVLVRWLRAAPCPRHGDRLGSHLSNLTAGSRQLLSAQPSGRQLTSELSDPLKSDRTRETHLAVLCSCCLAWRKILKVVRLFSNSWQAPGCEPDFQT